MKKPDKEVLAAIAAAKRALRQPTALGPDAVIFPDRETATEYFMRVRGMSREEAEAYLDARLEPEVAAS